VLVNHLSQIKGFISSLNIAETYLAVIPSLLSSNQSDDPLSESKAARNSTQDA